MAAIDRFRDPGDPLGGWMLLVGVVGLGVNVLAAWLMIRSGGDSLNVRAATRHVLVDQGADCHGLRFQLERLLHDRYGLDHTTLQVEHATGGLLEITR